MVYLSLETLLAGHSILIFCPSKAMCESLARQIAKEFYYLGHEFSDTCSAEIKNSIRKELNSDAIGDVIKSLENCPAGKDQALIQAVRFGVAFHHAGTNSFG